jgi:hypothetical protein
MIIAVPSMSKTRRLHECYMNHPNPDKGFAGFNALPGSWGAATISAWLVSGDWRLVGGKHQPMTWQLSLVSLLPIVAVI